MHKREKELRDALAIAEAAVKALEADTAYQAELASAVAAHGRAEASLRVAESNWHRVRKERLCAEASLRVAESNWHRVRKERLCAARIVTDRGPEWHPGLIASIEHATGWKYDEREDLKNANASDYTRDPFTTALMAVSERFVETDPDIRAARALCDYKANNSTYLAMTTIKRRMDDAKWAWQSAQANLDTYLVDRAERQAMSPKNEATKEWREREEARKSARKVLAEITDHPEKLAW